MPQYTKGNMDETAETETLGQGVSQQACVKRLVHGQTPG